MLAIKGIYDGKIIKPLENIPFDEKRKVIITFLEEPVDEIDVEADSNGVWSLEEEEIRYERISIL